MDIPKVCSTDLSLLIKQARIAKNMTQKELDIKCSLSVGTTMKYEKSTSIINQNILDKMSKVLGIILKK